MEGQDHRGERFTTRTASVTVLFASNLPGAGMRMPAVIWVGGLIVALFILALVTVQRGRQTRRVHA